MEHPLDLVRAAARQAPRLRRRPHRRRLARGSAWSDVRLVVVVGAMLGLAVAGADLNRIGFGAIAAPGHDTAARTEGGEVMAPRRFGLCVTGGGSDCVVDGDTFWIDGEKVRVADIDAPETHPPRCDEEARLGDAATLRMQALLNDGPVTLIPIDRDTDRYGRKLRVVERGGVSLGEMLVAEGLARRWEGRRRPWCGEAA